MQIPSTSALLDAFARITRFAEVRPPAAPQPADRPEATPGRVDTRQALLPPDPGERPATEFRHPPGDGPFRRGLLVDIRV